jgi:hypothetical protein
VYALWLTCVCPVYAPQVSLRLGTGRKHQIRATMRALGCSIVGDQRYGGAPPLAPAESESGGSGSAEPTAAGPGSGAGSEAGPAAGRAAGGTILLHAHRIAFAGAARGEPELEPGSGSGDGDDGDGDGCTQSQYDVSCAPAWGGGFAGLVAPALAART